MSDLADLFFFNDTATTEIYTLSLHDALPIFGFSVVAPISVTMPFSTHGRKSSCWARLNRWISSQKRIVPRSEEHTSELQSQSNLVCRLLLEKKKLGAGQLEPEAAAGSARPDP